MTTPEPKRIRGVLAPVLTPFRANLSIHHDLLLSHCDALLAQGLGLALFGTNSEATSVAPAERLEAIARLLAAGVPAQRMMPGAGCCSLAETVALTSDLLLQGIHSVLMLPPYFYKEADDDGLFAYYAEVIERVGSDALQLYLYNIPQYTQVALSPALVGRLLDRYPCTVAGYKDSSGDWSNTQALLARYAARGFDVFCASEVLLSDTLRAGGGGCISATANVNAAGIQRIVEGWDTDAGPAVQAAANAVRTVFQSRPMIAAMKACLAGRYGDDDWRRLRPPLRALSEPQVDSLASELAALDFH